MKSQLSALCDDTSALQHVGGNVLVFTSSNQNLATEPHLSLASAEVQPLQWSSSCHRAGLCAWEAWQ